mgnify:CR=1 FL=1
MWYQFLTGRNPRDEFRGRDILTEDELKAGGLYALEPMVRNAKTVLAWNESSDTATIRIGLMAQNVIVESPSTPSVPTISCPKVIDVATTKHSLLAEPISKDEGHPPFEGEGI